MGKELGSGRGMILPGFLSRKKRSAPGRIGERWICDASIGPSPDALVLLDEGMRCEQVAKVLTLGPMTRSGVGCSKGKAEFGSG